MAKVETTPLKMKYDLELVPGTVSKAMDGAGAKVVRGGNNGVYDVPPLNVMVLADFNVRMGGPTYDEHFKSVKNSIKVEGYDRTRPITVFIAKGDDGDDVITLEDGHTRLKAVLELIEEGVEIATIPAIVAPATRTLEDRLIALKRANDGAPLTPYETAVLVKRLENNGVERSRLAERLGYTDRYMRDLEILARTPKKVVVFMQEGRVSATEVLSVMRKDEKNVVTIISDAVKAAGAKGKAKATGKDTTAAGKKKKGDEGAGGSDEIETSGESSSVSTRGGKAVQTLVFKYKQGEMVTRDAIAITGKLKGGDWWKWNDTKKTHAFIEYDLTVEIKLTYKMEDEADATESEAVEQTAAQAAFEATGDGTELNGEGQQVEAGDDHQPEPETGGDPEPEAGGEPATDEGLQGL